jgi:putative salt-induced outer membrane protein YdiY
LFQANPEKKAAPRAMFPTNRCLAVVALLVLACFPAHGKVSRKDVVIMKNGDRLTGEVKRLENGVLYISTDYFSGSIGLDWLQVERVESTAGFQVTLEDGERVTGKIEKVPAEQASDKDFSVTSPAGQTRTAAPEVVSIESSKESFWRQLTGSIDVGYDYTSGNSLTSLSSDASVNYLAPKWFGGLSFNSSFSGQQNASQTNLIEGQTLDGIYLNRNSFLVGLGDFLHSSQQDLDLRSTLGGGYGRYLIRNNLNTLAWLGGLVYTHEDFAIGTGRPSDQSIEALLGAQYQLFHFDRYSLQSQLLVFPGLSDAGRVRATTKSTFSMKLTNNFHLDFSFWDNFDSRPPFNSKGNELGVSNSLGWTF